MRPSQTGGTRQAINDRRERRAHRLRGRHRRQRRQLAIAKAARARPPPRLRPPFLPVDRASTLRLPRRQRDPLHPLARQRAGRAQLGGALLDLDPPLRELSQHPLGHTVDLEQPAPDPLPGHPRQPLPHLGAERGAVHRPRRRLVLVQRVRVECRVAPVGAHQVRGDDMRVQLRIAGAGQPVPVRRRHEAVPRARARLHPARDESNKPRAPDTTPRPRPRAHAPRRVQPTCHPLRRRNRTETLFGAENVRSTAATVERELIGRSTAPSAGEHPRISAMNASRETRSPTDKPTPHPDTPEPSHVPAVSPRPA